MMRSTIADSPFRLRRACGGTIGRGLIAFGAIACLAAPMAAPATAAPSTAAAGSSTTSPEWNGRWTLTRYAASKTGTSLAARQSEPDFADVYTFRTSCADGPCVATVVGGPSAQNPTIPRPPKYTWNRTSWAEDFDWQWDCYMGPGNDKVWAPAHSHAYYTPQADGSKIGVWDTTIDSGPCAGTVSMRVRATPADLPTGVEQGARNLFGSS